jgi:hypothetical protein
LFLFLLFFLSFLFQPCCLSLRLFSQHLPYTEDQLEVGASGKFLRISKEGGRTLFNIVPQRHTYNSGLLYLKKLQKWTSQIPYFMRHNRVKLSLQHLSVTCW